VCEQKLLYSIRYPCSEYLHSRLPEQRYNTVELFIYITTTHATSEKSEVSAGQVSKKQNLRLKNTNVEASIMSKNVFFSFIANEDATDSLRVNYVTRFFKLSVGSSEVAVTNERIHYRAETTPSIVGKVAAVLLGFPLTRIVYQLFSHRTLAVPLSQVKYIERRLRPNLEYLFSWAIALYALNFFYSNYFNGRIFDERFSENHSKTKRQIEKHIEDTTKIIGIKRDSLIEAAKQALITKTENIKAQRNAARDTLYQGIGLFITKKEIYDAAVQRLNAEKREADSLYNRRVVEAKKQYDTDEDMVQTYNSKLIDNSYKSYQWWSGFMSYAVWVVVIGLFFGINYTALKLLLTNRIYTVLFVCENNKFEFVYQPHNQLEGVSASERDERIDSFIRNVYEAARAHSLRPTNGVAATRTSA